MVFVLAVHVPIIVLTFLPVLLGWPMLLMPVHVLCLQLVIDPACSLVFEAQPAEPGLMQVPPRPRQARLFDRRLLLAGMVALLALTSAVLSAVAAFGTLQVWHLAVGSLVNGFGWLTDNPLRRTLNVSLIGAYALDRFDEIRVMRTESCPVCQSSSKK